MSQARLLHGTTHWSQTNTHTPHRHSDDLDSKHDGQDADPDSETDLIRLIASVPSYNPYMSLALTLTTTLGVDQFQGRLRPPILTFTAMPTLLLPPPNWTKGGL
jgi:hypothetical protein